MRLVNWALFALIASLQLSCASYPRIIKDEGKCSDLPVTVKWTAPSNMESSKAGSAKEVHGYKIYLKSVADKDFREFIDTGIKTQQEFYRLIPGQEYDFRVVAYNDSGEGEPSGEIRRKVCENAVTKIEPKVKADKNAKVSPVKKSQKKVK